MIGQREVEGKNGPPFKILRFCHKGGVFLGCGLLRCCFLLVVFFIVTEAKTNIYFFSYSFSAAPLVPKPSSGPPSPSPSLLMGVFLELLSFSHPSVSKSGI